MNKKILMSLIIGISSVSMAKTTTIAKTLDGAVAYCTSDSALRAQPMEKIVKIENIQQEPIDTNKVRVNLKASLVKCLDTNKGARWSLDQNPSSENYTILGDIHQSPIKVEQEIRNYKIFIVNQKSDVVHSQDLTELEKTAEQNIVFDLDYSQSGEQFEVLIGMLVTTQASNGVNSETEYNRFGTFNLIIQ